MKVLLSAFACHPVLGSESAAGWKLALLLARNHRVHVLTQNENRSAIENYQFDPQTSGKITFSFLGPFYKKHSNRMIARIMSWVHYLRWLREVGRALGPIVQKEEPALIHHATIATWRIGIPFFGFGVPVVWGPLGGAARFPAQFLSGLSISGAAFEIVRNLGNEFGRYLPSVVRSCRRAAAIICGNEADASFIKKIRKRNSGVHVLSSAYFSEGEMDQFRVGGLQKEPNATLQAFAGGICIGSKGMQFALEAIALARQAGVKIDYTIASFGPELAHLQQTTEKLKLQEQVRFHPGFRGKAYVDILGKSHIFLMPSFREGSPRTILEAMLAGAVPVVCRASAQGEIVDEKVGFAAPIGSRRELVAHLARVLIQLDRNRPLLQKMGQAAQEKVTANHSFARFAQQIEDIYQSAILAKPSEILSTLSKNR